jgi:hypothetical protein
MARSGSFGTSVNPFGTGTFGGLAQYDIGDNLADLEAYRLEIAWGNGTITDGEYAASLAKLVAAAAPGSQARMSAQNKLDDVTYRIGRSQAEAQGPDALIAFDQQTLALMNPSNVRYREIADSVAARIKAVAASLAAELADRRARDYAAIVDAYNRGETSTESLLAWVENTRTSLPADAPDKDNWDSVQANLVERLVSEKDAQVYQDYQDRKMSGADFVAYLTGRRDAYSMDSPKWADADRRLRDAVKNVKDTANAKADQEFFNLYAEGKKSDASYLLYVTRRIAAMDPTDPQLPEWKSKLTQAAHSMAEDQLQHEVKTATTAAGDAKARKNLRDFYVAYARTLNPGSAEFRQTEEQILALKPAAAATGGGTSKGAGTGVGPIEVHKGVPKIIPTVGGLGFIVTIVTPSARESKKAQAISVANLRLNLQEAQSALNEGDKVWLFHDPRYPGQTVAERDASGALVKRDAKGRIDPKGKQSYVAGSSYRTTSSDAVAGLQMATANYSFDLADVAAAKGDVKAYDTALWHGKVALERVRTTQARAVQVDITNHLKAIDAGIEVATKTNNPAAAVNLLMEKHELLEQAASDARLDSAAQESWTKKLDAVEDDPRYPQVQKDFSGQEILGPDGRRAQIGGSVDIAASPKNPDGSLVVGQAVRAPGWHFVLKTGSDGKAAWTDEWEDPQLGTWAANPDGTINRVAVQTGVLGVRVTGWVKVEKAGTLGIRFTTTTGDKKYVPYSELVDYISYRDGYGNLINGYSLDGGKTWLQTTGGQPPVLELTGAVDYKVAPDGSVTVTDAKQNVLFRSGPNESNWQAGDGLAKAGAAGAIGWFGQANLKTYGVSKEGVGYPGQQFRLVTSAPDPSGQASLNFVPNEVLSIEMGQWFARNQVQGPDLGFGQGDTTASTRLASGINPFVGFTTGARQDSTVQARAAYAELAARKAARIANMTPSPTSTWAGGTPKVNAATGFTTGPDEAWRAAGSFASSLVSALPEVVSGIITLGDAIVSAVSPPTWLPPVYVAPLPAGFTISPTYVPPAIPALKPPPYVAPSSLTQPPKVTPPKPAATPVQISKMTPSPTSPGGTIPKAPPKPPPTPTTTPGVTRPGGLPTGPQR